MSDKIIRMYHIRAAEVCASGARDWMKAHGFDWNEFLDNGIEVSRIEVLDDAIANKICAVAKGENHG